MSEAICAPRVRNKRTDDCSGAVYIGRPLDNPFKVGKHSTRREAIRRYEEYLRSRPHLMGSLHELRGSDLACWCALQPCHAEVLLRLANGTVRNYVKEALRVAEQGVEAVFEVERETKNTIRLTEVEGDNAPIIGTLYLHKHAYKRLGSPQRVKVRVEATGS